MIYYVAHKYCENSYNLKRAAKITRELQIDDPNNCYICPLVMFSHLKYGTYLTREQEMALCLDILSVCDVLLVCSDVSEGVQTEIDFANRVGMEVEYYNYR